MDNCVTIVCTLLLIQGTFGEIKSQNEAKTLAPSIAKLGQFPYQVSLSMKRGPSYQQFCSGSIIHKNYVLTAAHCVHFIVKDEIPLDMISIWAGGINNTSKENYWISFKPERIFIPAEYNKKSFQIDDVSVIKINGEFPIDTNRHIRVIKLLNSSLPPDTHCYVSGWGTKSGTPSKHLLFADDIKISKHDWCQQKYHPLITDGMICAGNHNGLDACHGDAGGPLVCNGLLTGVFSFGVDCSTPNRPGVYSNVSYYQPWIENIIHSSGPNIKFNILLMLPIFYVLYFL